IAFTASYIAPCIIAKLRVGWMVAGCAPGVRTMTRSILFHCTTWLTGFVAWAIAGARFAAASKATVVPAINRVFISVLRDVYVSVSSSRSIQLRRSSLTKTDTASALFEFQRARVNIGECRAQWHRDAPVTVRSIFSRAPRGEGAESHRWSRLRAAVGLPIIIGLEAAQCGGIDVRHGPEAHPGARPVQQVEAFAGRRCGTAVLKIRDRPDEQVYNMLVVLENQSADHAVVNVIEPTADQRKALRREVDHRWRGIELAVEPRLDRVPGRGRHLREAARP